MRYLGNLAQPSLSQLLEQPWGRRRRGREGGVRFLVRRVTRVLECGERGRQGGEDPYRIQNKM